MNPVEPNEMTVQIREDLRAADLQGDDARLKALDDLYASLERELERDIDQAGPARF